MLYWFQTKMLFTQGRKRLLDEMIRIPVYQQKGDLATFEELTEYYRARGDKNKIPPELTNLKIISDYINRMNLGVKGV